MGQSNAKGAWLTCPECCTLTPLADACSLSCGHDISWLDKGRYPRFWQALIVDNPFVILGHWNVQLEAKASWLDVRTAVQGPLDGPITIPVPGLPSLRYDNETGTVELREQGSLSPVSVPGTILRNGIEVRVQMLAMPKNALLEPLAIGRTTKEFTLKHRETALGRLDQHGIKQLSHVAVEEQHCIIVHRPGTASFYIVDRRTASGTFVNRRPVLVRCLQGGDLVQVGPFAWIFNEVDGFFVPTEGIVGADVKITGLRVPNRLGIDSLHIPAKRFVAIVGASGAGKSTLIKAVARLPEVKAEGSVLIDGFNVDQHERWYRSILGYMPQEAILHAQLSPLQALRFNIRLRLGRANTDEVKKTLRELDIPESRWNAPIAELSGGEQKRVRIANEIVMRPRLLMLDEPASGLDAEREKSLVKMLRSLSHQGCTVVMVTHGKAHQGVCDEEFDVSDESFFFHETGRSPRHAAEEGKTSRLQDGQPKEPGADWRARRTARMLPQTGRLLTQAQVLVQRELLLTCKGWKKLIVPVVIVPLVFALSIHLGLGNSTKLDMLGFLAILATIWMGASLSLLSIVSEREIIDHEVLFYLRIPSYVLAKFLVWSLISAGQVSCFFAALWLMRGVLDWGPMLYTPWWTWLSLLSTAIAAIALGLFISALSGRRKETANLILPLIMMMQIIFSVQVSDSDKTYLQDVYGRFQIHRCAVWPDRRADMWIPAYGGWVCARARTALQRKLNGTAIGTNQSEVFESLRATQPTADAQEEGEQALPSWLSPFFSYFTLSRYADIILRSFAYDEQSSLAFAGQPSADDSAQRYDYAGWRNRATFALVLLITLLVAATMMAMWWQNSAMTLKRIAKHAEGGFREGSSRCEVAAKRIKLWLRKRSGAVLEEKPLAGRQSELNI